MKITLSALLTVALLHAATAQADFSANVGFASDYYYRGIFQAQSSASGGIDFEKDGFYAGTWAADVKDGIEIDGYLGFSSAIGEFGYSVGYTGYFYTGDFDDTYQEINLGGTYGLLALDLAVGEYENFAGPTLDYTYYSLTIEKDGFHGRYAGFSQDASGEYFEFGYATTVSDVDLGINLIFNDKNLSGDGKSDEALIFTIGKAFDL